MTTTPLTLTAGEFRGLVNPVLPLASGDSMHPVLNAVLVESEGKWLSATATDRFRIGIKRIEKRASDEDPGSEWPEFRALIPVRAVKSLLTAFKERRGTLPATLTLTVEDDKLTTEAVGLFDLFDSGRFVHYLEHGNYPEVRRLVREALAIPVEDRVSSIGINPALFADFKACGAQTLRVLVGSVGKPLVVTDDNGFIGALMPRRLDADYQIEDWADFLADKPQPKEKAA